MLEALKEEVFNVNRELERLRLATLTFGNASGFDASRKLMAIKPSGVPYSSLTPADIVLMDLKGKVVEGKLRPSSDAPTHLVLYRVFQGIGGIVHTHSPCATMFAQACRAIPCLGTTHADHFKGEVPVTRWLRQEEVEKDYEENTGRVIVERFDELNPREIPAVLVANHGPFAWGRSASEALMNSLALEEIAKMALGTMYLNDAVVPIPGFLLAKHFNRKHGPEAYYGQERT